MLHLLETHALLDSSALPEPRSPKNVLEVGTVELVASQNPKTSAPLLSSVVPIAFLVQLIVKTAGKGITVLKAHNSPCLLVSVFRSSIHKKHC
jgi:hypothetical protein